MSPSDVVREFYKAFVAGDVPGIVARLAPDVVVDEPAALPYGEVHRGREAVLQSVLGAVSDHVAIEFDEPIVYESAYSAVGRLSRLLTGRFTGERLATMVEVHEVDGEQIQRIDVYTKDPAESLAMRRETAQSHNTQPMEFR